MKANAVEPEIEAREILAGAQFADAYCIMVEDAALDARMAAERMFARAPRWIAGLMAARDFLVSPLGLKTAAAKPRDASKTIGVFPIVSASPTRLIVGFDDKHLDFRVVVDVLAEGSRRRVTATTVVLTHNALGRAYLAMVLPFHRLIVPSMLRRIAKQPQA